MRFTATLTEALPWTVTIRDADDAVIATGSGTGAAVDWTWDASATPFGDFSYAIEAGPDLRPARGTVPGPPPLEVTSLTASPHAVTPNEDGIGESTSVSFALSTRASVAVEVINSSSKVVRTLASSFSYSAGRASMAWNGRNSSGHLVQDGRYRIRITATSPGQQARKSHGIVVDRTLGHLEIAPTPFSPNGDGRLDSTAIGFRLARQADVRVRIMDGDRVGGNRPRARDARSRRRVRFLGRPQQERGGRGRRLSRARRGDDDARDPHALGSRSRIDTRAPAVRIVSARHRKDGRTGCASG